MKIEVTNQLCERTTKTSETENGEQMVLAKGKIDVSITWHGYDLNGGFDPSPGTYVTDGSVSAGDTRSFSPPSTNNFSRSATEPVKVTLSIRAPGNQVEAAVYSVTFETLEHDRYIDVLYKVVFDKNDAWYYRTHREGGSDKLYEGFVGSEACQNTH